MTGDNDIKRIEEFLRIYHLIKDSETLSDFVSRPFEQSNKSVEDLYQSLKDNLGGGVILKVPVLIAFSGAFFDTEKETDNILIKANAGKLRESINKLIIKELSPFVLLFFKWDLDRRVWKNPDDEYKVAYLQKLTTDLDDELQGRNQIVKKYVHLILECGLSYFKDLISKVNPNEIPNAAEALDTIRKLESVVNTDKLDDIIDDDAESSFSKIYAPMAQYYINGLLRMTNKYDFLLYAFIEAQNDYKKLVNKLLVPSIITDISKIREALSQKEIDNAISVLRSFFATIPNQLYGKQNEAIYHISFHIILKLIGCDIQSSVSTSDGIIDAFIEFPNLTYIIEIKLTNSDKAMEQIKEKEYDLGFRHKNKALYRLGIAFDTSKRNIEEEYSLEEVKQ